jgi:hypothetical protein
LNDRKEKRYIMKNGGRAYYIMAVSPDVSPRGTESSGMSCVRFLVISYCLGVTLEFQISVVGRWVRIFHCN